MPKEFENIFKELLDLGSEPIELNFWRELIPALSVEAQNKLKENFEKQLELLKEKKKLEEGSK